jgi:PAS domain S-box-containing protein
MTNAMNTGPDTEHAHKHPPATADAAAARTRLGHLWLIMLGGVMVLSLFELVRYLLEPHLGGWTPRLIELLLGTITVTAAGFFALRRMETLRQERKTETALRHKLKVEMDRHGKAVEALRESEARLRGILDNTVEGMITIDEQGAILSFNPAAERIFGYPADAVLGRNVSLLMPSPYRGEHDGYITRYLSSGESGILGRGRELRGQRQDGSIFPLCLAVSEFHDGKGRCFTGIIRDITQQKQAEEALLTRTRQLVVLSQLGQQVVSGNSMPLLMTESVNLVSQTLKADYVGILEARAETGELLLKAAVGWQAALVGRAVLAANPNTLPGLALSSAAPVVVDDLRADPRFQSESALLQVRGLVSGIGVLIGSQDRPYGVLCACSSKQRRFSEDDSNFLQSVANLLAEAIERHRAEARTHRLQGELLRVTRSSAVGELGTTLAHELNQPITAVVNYVQACRRVLLQLPIRKEPAARVRGLMDKAVAESERAAAIIQRLRQFVAKGELQRTGEDINEVVREAAKLALAGTLDNHVSVRFELASELPRAFIDKVQVRQVLFNLVRNAIEALEDAPRREIHIQTLSGAGGMIEVMVRDFGPGIPEDQLEQLFDQRISSKPGGMGIGLSICRSIITAHGGRLWVTPTPDGGATFHFTLPASVDDAQR